MWDLCQNVADGTYAFVHDNGVTRAIPLTEEEAIDAARTLWLGRVDVQGERYDADGGVYDALTLTELRSL